MEGTKDNEFDPQENISADEKAEAEDPTIGSGTPDDAPWDSVETSSWLERQPLIVMILGVVIVDAAALVTTLAGASTGVVAALLGTLATVLAIVGRWVWLHVTPIADPKLAPGVPLKIDEERISV